MDRGLATIIGSAAMLGVLGVYVYTARETKADSLVDQINQIATVVSNLYGSTPNQYLGMTAQILAQNEAMPARWTRAGRTRLTSVYDSDIDVTANPNPVTGIANGSWAISIYNVPVAACTVLGTTTFAPQMLGTSINGNYTGTPGFPIGNQTTVTSACKTQAGGTGTVPVVILFFA